MGRLLIALTLALGFLARPAPAAAGAEWCEFDLLIVIVTPAGRVVPIFVTNGALGLEHALSAQLAEMHYTATPTYSGQKTRVRLEVLVHGDLFDQRFETRSTASTGPLATGNVFARQSGVSGDVMRLTFTLDVP